MLKEFQSWWVQKYRQSSELHDCRRVNLCNCNLVTGSFRSSNVRVAAAIPQQLREAKIRKLIRENDPVECESTSWMVLKVLFTPHRRS